MKPEIASRYSPRYICPLCEFLAGDEGDIEEHLINKHTDDEAWWNEQSTQSKNKEGI